MESWKEEQCSAKPEAIQQVAPNCYIQRRNIEEVHHEAEGGMPAYTSWKCECRFISDAEYGIMLSKDAISKAEYVAMMADVDIDMED